MRLSLKKIIQWLLLLVLIHVAVYFMTIKRHKSYILNVQLHRFLEPLSGPDGTCSFGKCPRVINKMVNVHLIPHSHIDVGWTKSVDQYYVGEYVPNVWASGCVRCTFNATITELLKDRSRRFILVEMKFLARYWDELDESQRGVILQLIKERRLEIINGGWVMSDAAVTYYNDIIDQHTLGFDFVRDKFGSCANTRTAWHVDQFGHSREHASLFAQMGYDSLFIGRLDFQDLKERIAQKNLEFVWNTSPHNFKEKSALFTQVFVEGYYAPASYNFEVDHIDWSNNVSAVKAAADFLNILKERAKMYQTNHILIPMGCDFGYKDASNWFTSMDNLIKMVSELQQNSSGTKFNLLYSTPSCYTYHANRARALLTVKENDFHAYGIAPGVYWTGYFTTRGGFKMHIKRAGQILQSCKQMSILNNLDDTFTDVNALRDALAVMQHHDAITGTQRYAVLQDYNSELSWATEQCEKVMSMANQRLWNQVGGTVTTYPAANSHFCPSLNISNCDISEGSQPFLISLYNPLSWAVDVSVRFPVSVPALTVVDAKENQIPVQMVPVPEGVMKIPERKAGTDTEAIFQANLPPMSTTSFVVKPVKGEENANYFQKLSSEIVIENEHLSLTFSAQSGRLESIYNKESKIREKLDQNFLYYEVDERERRTSGAYLFVPKLSRGVNVTSEKVEIDLIKGNLVEEVHQRFSQWAYQVIRLYKGATFAEFQWVVGPLDNTMGKEVISRFTTRLDSRNTFYTDSNGREVIKRTRKVAGTNSSTVYDTISGNYYPVASRIFIQDKIRKIQLTVLPDRPQGGSSLESGSLELLVHRKTLTDDDLGIAQPLKDRGSDGEGIIFTGKHFVFLENIEDSSRLTRHMALQLHLGPVPMFTLFTDNTAPKAAPIQHTFLTSPLPDSVQILTLDRISEKEVNLFLLRLEHVFEYKEHPKLSVPVTLSLETLFKPFKVISAQETTLGGNFRPRDIQRMSWKTTKGKTPESISSPDYKEVMQPPFTIQLQPMEIRTFRIQVVWSDKLYEQD